MKTTVLKLTTAVAIAGEVMPADSLVEVSRSEASDLLRRGRAVVHKHDPESGEPVKASGTDDSELHPDIAEFQQDREEQASEEVDTGDNTDAEEQATEDKPAAGRAGRKK